MRRTALVCCCVGATSLAPTTRRQWLQRASAAAIAVPTAASAGSKLEDGLALPDGAAQRARRVEIGRVEAVVGLASSTAARAKSRARARRFQHFRDVQGEWTRFGERLSRENIDDKEWRVVRRPDAAFKAFRGLGPSAGVAATPRPGRGLSVDASRRRRGRRADRPEGTTSERGSREEEVNGPCRLG